MVVVVVVVMVVVVVTHPDGTRFGKFSANRSCVAVATGVTGHVEDGHAGTAAGGLRVGAVIAVVVHGVELVVGRGQVGCEGRGRIVPRWVHEGHPGVGGGRESIENDEAEVGEGKEEDEEKEGGTGEQA